MPRQGRGVQLSTCRAAVASQELLQANSRQTIPAGLRDAVVPTFVFPLGGPSPAPSPVQVCKSKAAGLEAPFFQTTGIHVLLLLSAGSCPWRRSPGGISSHPCALSGARGHWRHFCHCRPQASAGQRADSDASPWLPQRTCSCDPTDSVLPCRQTQQQDQAQLLQPWRLLPHLLQLWHPLLRPWSLPASPSLQPCLSLYQSVIRGVKGVASTCRCCPAPHPSLASRCSRSCRTPPSASLPTLHNPATCPVC